MKGMYKMDELELYDRIDTVAYMLEYAYDNPYNEYDIMYFTERSSLELLSNVTKKYSKEIRKNVGQIRKYIKSGDKESARKLCAKTRKLTDEMNKEFARVDKELYNQPVGERILDWFLMGFLSDYIMTFIYILAILTIGGPAIPVVLLSYTQTLISEIKLLVKDIKSNKFDINSFNPIRRMAVHYNSELNKLINKVERKLL